MRIGVLLYDGVQILDATGPAAAFEIAGRFGAQYELVMLASGCRIVSSGGIAVETVPLSKAAPCDTIIVPGGNEAAYLSASEELLQFISQAVSEGRRVASVCSGAFILASAGLLDGRRATTHWSVAHELKRRFPSIEVDPESLFVEDSGIWTSAGIAAGIDLSLAIIARDQGEDVARRVAQRMVVYHRRPGTQSQHSALLDMVTPDNRFSMLLAWARERLHQDLNVEQLAQRACLSPRHFTRAFTASTGFSPAKAIERLRVEAARSMIEAGEPSMERVARTTGFGSAERMRRAFVKITGQAPLSLRRSASHSSPARKAVRPIQTSEAHQGSQT